MADLLELSARFIDQGRYEGPGSVNRVTTELSEIREGVAVIEAFSHVVAFQTVDGLVLFDTSLERFAPAIVAALRRWSTAAVHTIVYTHGHLDHVGGAQSILEEARQSGAVRPRVVGHQNVAARFDRYQLTEGYNAAINARQFGVGRVGGFSDPRPGRFGPRVWVRPDTTVREGIRLRVGELQFELRHARGETDDHLWAWLPEYQAICSGDFLTWVFPNAGNPQKVQRYPLEWAATLREMATLGAQLLLPAHGLPIAGVERIRGVLDDVASALESLVEQTLLLMNQGARLSEILHSVELPRSLLDKPYLRPVYDEPEFVVRNAWRLYGGWYDGNPAQLKPAPEAQLCAELARLVGGEERLVRSARERAGAGDLRLACHLIEIAVQADPRSRDAHRARAEIYEQRRRSELSLMARGIFRDTVAESRAVADGDD